MIGKTLTLVVYIRMRGERKVRILRDVRMTCVYPPIGRHNPRSGGFGRSCLVVHFMSISRDAEYYPLKDIETLMVRVAER